MARSRPKGGAGLIAVFIENEAGSDIKHHYDEATFEVIETERVGAEYPYPYGFVPGTLAPDGDAVDCFVLTSRELRSGTTIHCEPLALLEQTEGGEVDHNILAVPQGDPAPNLLAAQEIIGSFLDKFMAGVAERRAVMGRLLPVDDAITYLADHRTAKPPRPSQP
ncbi:MAG: inorganic diphosphatase [Acidimicrobiia bacterium]